MSQARLNSRCQFDCVILRRRECGLSTFEDQQDEAQVPQLHNGGLHVAGKYVPSRGAIGDADEDLSDEPAV